MGKTQNLIAAKIKFLLYISLETHKSLRHLDKGDKTVNYVCVPKNNHIPKLEKLL